MIDQNLSRGMSTGARLSRRTTLILFNLVHGGLCIGLLATVAHFVQSSFVFPSLGPTAFLLFTAPDSRAASPRNAFLGHLIGATVGWLSLAVFGLLDAPPTYQAGVDWPRVGAAALSLGATSALMLLFDAAHPPAGSTTLIVSLGAMPHFWQIPCIVLAVLLLVGLAWTINRLAGIPYPLWAQPDPGTDP